MQDLTRCCDTTHPESCQLVRNIWPDCVPLVVRVITPDCHHGRSGPETVTPSIGRRKHRKLTINYLGPYSSGAYLGGDRIRFDRVYGPSLLRIFSSRNWLRAGEPRAFHARPGWVRGPFSHVKGPERQRRCFYFLLILLLFCWVKGHKRLNPLIWGLSSAPSIQGSKICFGPTLPIWTRPGGAAEERN